MRKRTPEGGNRPSKRKRLFIILGALIGAGVFMLILAYTFVYDGFGIVYHAISWQAELPEDMEMDRSLEERYVTGRNGYLYLRVSRESSPYLDIQGYIDRYFDRFYTDPAWLEANGAELLRNETEGRRHVVTVRVGTMPEGYEDTYTFVTLRTGTRYFVRALLKYDSRTHGAEGAAAAERFADTLKSGFHGSGRRLETDLRPVIPESWNEETRWAYDKLCRSDRAVYGVFSHDTAGLEERLGRSFPIELTYFHLNDALPRDRLEGFYEQGKLTELTLQLTETANYALESSPSVLIGVLAGRYDEELEAIAEGLRDFGHPVLFRLDNEMNSDWTSYSGVVNLADPELHTAVWRYIYGIFEEKGVGNAIWIFNPNDEDYPPARWNSWLAYYPGNGYVQMLGVTGYNTGTYYAGVTGERWRSFTQIYDAIEEELGPHFGEFPWIITEFGSSSVGGDKAEWIRDMFRHMGDYENIKAAVWFDHADFDETKEGSPVARPYWIGETEETLRAFEEGLEENPERFFE